MPRVRQAGAVAYREDASGRSFLLVRARITPDWIFPKGHLEPGESLEQAAVRELWEEAGVAGSVVDSLGTLQFRSGDEDVEVTYFLVRTEPGGVLTASVENREKLWLPLNEAREQLSHQDARGLLDNVAGNEASE